MKLRDTVITSLLIAIGFVLHAVTPGIGGMKFDLLLAFMILAILINPTLQNTLSAGILGGIMAALTTTFPGGQPANLIDKFITALVVYALIRSLAGLKNDSIRSAVIGFFATMVSGTVFLSVALFVAGLPLPFSVLFLSVVLPTAVTNGGIMIVLYKASSMAMRSLQPSRRA